MASIRTRAKADGSQVHAVLWRDADTGRQTSMQFASKPDADNFKRIIEANSGSLTRTEAFLEEATIDGPTLAEVVTNHIAHVTGAEPYTVKRYRDYLRLHIAPSPIGHRKITAIKGNDLRQWIIWMEARGKSPKTIANVFGVLSSAMIGAARDGIISTNPCAGVRLPRREHAGDDGEMTKEDFGLIHGAIDPHFHPFLDLLLGAGLRYSEAWALEPADFKLDAKTPTVRVNKAWKQDDEESEKSKGKWYIGPPKTSKSKRTVSLAPSTVAAVRDLVDNTPSGLLVFRMKRGGVMTPQAFYNRAWGRARASVGLEDKVTVHSIRHLHAAIMLEAGMPMYDLSRRMGHEDISITVNLYSHLLPDAHFNAAQYAQRALGS